MYKDLIRRLEEAGITGLDLSLGNPLCFEAASAIRDLDQINAKLDKIIELVSPRMETTFWPGLQLRPTMEEMLEVK